MEKYSTEANLETSFVIKEAQTRRSRAEKRPPKVDANRDVSRAFSPSPFSPAGIRQSGGNSRVRTRRVQCDGADRAAVHTLRHRQPEERLWLCRAMKRIRQRQKQDDTQSDGRPGMHPTIIPNISPPKIIARFPRVNTFCRASTICCKSPINSAPSPGIPGSDTWNTYLNRKKIPHSRGHCKQIDKRFALPAVKQNNRENNNYSRNKPILIVSAT